MEQFLHNLPIFHGVEISEIKSLLVFLTAQRKSYKKSEIILSEGETTDCIGVVLSGLAMLQLGDIWGNNSVVGSVRPGGTFAEAYVCLADDPCGRCGGQRDTLFEYASGIGSVAVPGQSKHPTDAQLTDDLCAKNNAILTENTVYKSQDHP